MDAQMAPSFDDDIAIKVENVGRTYELWSSPSARLTYPLLGLARRWRPQSAWLARKRAAMFTEFQALADISLEIKKGESWGFIGVNGSGKSTLLKIIAGNLRPTSGRVEVDGKVTKLDYTAGLHGDFTGRENIRLKAALYGMSPRETEEKMDSIIEFAEIGDFIDRPVNTYSSGMTARLGFAIISHMDADIIITDEALAVGDAFFVQKCMRYIRNFLKNGTFILVSHSTNDIVSLCQKAVWLEHGRIRDIGVAKDVTDAYLASRNLSESRRLLKEQKADGATGAEEAEATKTEIAAVPPSADRVATTQPRLAELGNAQPARKFRDPRQDMINASRLRHDIILPEFDPETPGFGIGGARITDIWFTDEAGDPLSCIIGGETARLVIQITAERTLMTPLVGFQVKDRLGQSLFADNTFLTTQEQPFTVAAGKVFAASFQFQMPLLPGGEYVIRVAVADGVADACAVLHCIDNALLFTSVTQGPRHGLVGIPMEKIELALITTEAPGG